MSSGEGPIGAARGTQSDTEALCQPPPPPKGPAGGHAAPPFLKGPGGGRGGGRAPRPAGRAPGAAPRRGVPLSPSVQGLPWYLHGSLAVAIPGAIAYSMTWGLVLAILFAVSHNTNPQKETTNWARGEDWAAQQIITSADWGGKYVTWRRAWGTGPATPPGVACACQASDQKGQPTAQERCPKHSSGKC